MKKSVLFVAIAGMLAIASSCRKAETLPVSFSVKVDESALVNVPMPESYLISVTNLSTAETVTAQTENSTATFSVIPGLYSISASASASEDGVAFYYAGTLNSVNVSADNQTFDVPVSVSESSALIIKELYFTNSGDYYIREQYCELYNNSDQVVYLDGLCIAETTKYYYDGQTPYNFEIENPENYVFTQYVWQIPGNGSEYPLGPGESAVIAQWATDHSLPELNPDSAIGDLTSAEFEALTAETTVGDVVITDNPAINMINPVSAYSRPQWMLTSSGPSMIIFYPEGELNSTNMIAATANGSSLYGGAREIPIEWVLDAVDVVDNETMIQYKKLPESLDAGVIWIEEGAYCGKSISRKVGDTLEDGRVVYMDTNNTSNDFQVNDTPELRRGGAGIPSWNTWAN